MLWSYGAKFIDKALIGTEMQAMFIVDKAHEPIRIVSNKINNEHKIRSSIMVSVVDFESEYPGSSPDQGDIISFQYYQLNFLMMIWQTIQLLI